MPPAHPPAGLAPPAPHQRSVMGQGLPGGFSPPILSDRVFRRGSINAVNCEEFLDLASDAPLLFRPFMVKHVDFPPLRKNRQAIIRSGRKLQTLLIGKEKSRLYSI